LELALDALAHVVGLHPERLGEALVQGIASRAGRWDLIGPHLDRQADAVVHQHAAVAVEDLPARRLDLDLPHAVVVRVREVLVAREDLEVPEAEEDDREHDQREAADDRHAERELRRDRRAPVGVEVHQTSRPRSPIGPEEIVESRRARGPGSTSSTGLSTRRAIAKNGIAISAFRSTVISISRTTRSDTGASIESMKETAP